MSGTGIDYLLMGVQAAGLIGDIWANEASLSISKRGQQLEEAQLDLRLKQEQLASNEQSIANLEQLAETLATQRALMSIRGGTPGVGSNLAVEGKAISTFNRDEQARALSLQFLGVQREAQKAVGRITLAGKQAEAGAKSFGKAFNMIPFSELSTKLKTPTTASTSKIGDFKFDTSIANWSKKNKTGLLTG